MSIASSDNRTVQTTGLKTAASIKVPPKPHEEPLIAWNAVLEAHRAIIDSAKHAYSMLPVSDEGELQRCIESSVMLALASYPGDTKEPSDHLRSHIERKIYKEMQQLVCRFGKNDFVVLSNLHKEGVSLLTNHWTPEELDIPPATYRRLQTLESFLFPDETHETPIEDFRSVEFPHYLFDELQQPPLPEQLVEIQMGQLRPISPGQFSSN